MSSPRTIIRDAIAQAFEQSQGVPDQLLSEYQLSRLWLSETELKQRATYCVVVSDETRAGASSMQTDEHAASVKVVCWASDATDPHGLLDDMIEHACDRLRMALAVLKEARQISMGLIDEISVADAKSTDGPLAQAIIRLTVTFQRPGVRA